jgi:parallel beta-helix repeat protein
MVSRSLRLALSALVGMCAVPLIGFLDAGASAATLCAGVTTCNLWVSSSGDDSNDGRSEATPLRSLQRANDLLCQQTWRRCSGIGKTVKVTIAAGIYPYANTVWSYSDPNHATQIIGQDVVMDGRYSTDFGLHISPKNARSNIQVFYIKWTRYLRGGMTIGVGDHNRIYKNTFYRIGSYYSKQPEAVAYAGIYLYDNQDTSIEKSVFVDILNTGSGYSHEHGLYIIHSTNNRVTGSTFSNVGGDPIRVRDASNYNTISGNTFTNTGSNGYIGDWRCLNSADTTCPGPEKSLLCGLITTCSGRDESLSWNNSFKDNVLQGPHQWHFSGFTTRYCYDLRGSCPSQRIAG